MKRFMPYQAHSYIHSGRASERAEQKQRAFLYTPFSLNRPPLIRSAYDSRYYTYSREINQSRLIIYIQSNHRFDFIIFTPLFQSVFSASLLFVSQALKCTTVKFPVYPRLPSVCIPDIRSCRNAFPLSAFLSAAARIQSP